jgi:hypothetical protein
MIDILKMHEGASRQKMNTSKTSIFFSKNTTMGDREQILKLAEMPATQRYDTYLGLSAVAGKSRMTVFRSIIERIWKQLQDRKLNFLSQAEKEIILKVVIQAIPTYCMSVLFSKALCLEIIFLMQSFGMAIRRRRKKLLG